MISLISNTWIYWLTQRKRWVPTLVLIPGLYFLGWITVQPLLLIDPGLQERNLSLIGTLFSFFLFLVLLPSWAEFRWGKSKAWQAVGVECKLNWNSIRIFLRGLLYAISFLSVLILVISVAFLGVWIGDINQENFYNAIALGLGVGFAEELIFRGWLLVELSYLYGPRFAIVAQALIFSIVHIRFDLQLLSLVSLLFGLFLLGLLLAFRRIFDKGSLLGCIGFHGGLVGVWFALNSGLFEIPVNAPVWLVGVGNVNGNPLGGALAIFILLLTLWFQRTAFAMAGKP